MKPPQKDWVKLNVGGVEYLSTKNTLTSKPNTIFVLMFEVDTTEGQEKYKSLDDKEKMVLSTKMQKWNQADGAFKFDRDPEYFKPILNYLRTGHLHINKNIPLTAVLEEAAFYEVSELEILLKKEVEKEKLRKERAAKFSSSWEDL
uniref:BTB domain-containing protein n=1 Tax=Arcella intermedia TaxID=1963864 RepID=A0A6B2LP05_9EUKA